MPGPGVTPHPEAAPTMLFPTFDYLLFLLPVLVVFWAIAHRPVARVLWLLGASYFFYMAGPKTTPLPTPWYFVGLLGFSTVLDFVCGHQIHRHAADVSSADPAVAATARRTRNGYLVASLVGNLGLLGYFKYTDFFVATATDVAQALGLSWTAPSLPVILPLGISFYTFQSLSYTIDVWRGRLTPEPSFRKFALFVTFFPQLVAGPIVRASELLPQLHIRPRLSARRMEEGLFRIFKGLAKKVILGDWIAGHFTDAVFTNPDAYASPEIMLALYAFTVQLYADFSGYSDIAIGTARLLGFDIPENFDRPYQSRNLGEFWRRWHMTLSTWLRDYLFFPLGGSRGSTARTYFNLWLTMFLVGMWHYKTGTSWNFVIYANLHGLAMLFNRWNRTRDRALPASRKLMGMGAAMAALGLAAGLASHTILGLSTPTSTTLGVLAAALFAFVTWLPVTGSALNTALHIGLTFHFTVLSRIFFRAPDFDTARRMCERLLTWDGVLLRPNLLPTELWIALGFGLVYHWTPKRWVDIGAWGLFRRIPGPVLGALMALLALLLMRILDGSPKAFVYFQF
ncbi:MAG: MBOAT family O-acyltransferase [Myxococcota bacterium]